MHARSDRSPTRATAVTHRQADTTTLVGLGVVFLILFLIGLWGRLRHS